MAEYGYPVFGTEEPYGLRTCSWITAGYQRVAAFGPSSKSPSGYAMEFFERIDTESGVRGVDGGSERH